MRKWTLILSLCIIGVMFLSIGCSPTEDNTTTTPIETTSSSAITSVSSTLTSTSTTTTSTLPSSSTSSTTSTISTTSTTSDISTTTISTTSVTTTTKPTLPVIELPYPEVQRILAEDLKKLIDEKADFVLVDARADYLYEEGHLPGAINIPDDLSEIALEMKLTGLPANKLIVFYCD